MPDQPDPPDLIEVTIDSVRVSLMSPQRIVIVREKNGDRFLPIWVGPYEAEAITVALQEVEVSRPMTHDLLKNVFNTFNALLVRVEIQSLKEDIFFGNIVVELDGKMINIDSRSSDAIALAVRAHIPIMVAREVLDTAAIKFEKDIQDADQELEGAEDAILDQVDPPAPPTPEEEERLSVFDDFLANLDSSEPPDENKKEDPPDPDKKKPTI
ncbi:bifunctional nuclease family protein [Chloroflexota bacterium]